MSSPIEIMREAWAVCWRTAFSSCRRVAKYCSPGDWCSKHWKMWWNYGAKGKKPLPYMKEPKRR